VSRTRPVRDETYAYNRAYELEVFVRTTLNIEEELIHKAEELTGIHEKTHLVRLGLEALIAGERGANFRRTYHEALRNTTGLRMLLQSQQG
jgi:hypothetical protein